MEFLVGRAIDVEITAGDRLRHAYIRSLPGGTSSRLGPIWAQVNHQGRLMTVEVIVTPSVDGARILLPPSALEFLKATPTKSTVSLTLRSDFTPAFASKASVAPHLDAEGYAPALREFFKIPRLVHPLQVFTLPLHDGDINDEPIDARKPSRWPLKIRRDGISDFSWIEVVSFQISQLDGPEPMLISTERTQLDVSGVLRNRRRVPFAIYHLRGVQPYSILPSLRRAYELIVKLCSRTLCAAPKTLLSGARGTGKRAVVRLAAQKMGFHVTEVNCFSLAGAGDQCIVRTVREAPSPGIVLLRRFQALTVGHLGHTANEVNQQKLSATIRTTMDKLPSDRRLVLIISVDDPEDLGACIRDNFDIEISLGRPCETSRALAIQRLCAEHDVTEDWVNQTQGFSYSDLRAALRPGERASRIKEISGRMTASVTSAGVSSVAWADIGGMETAKNEVIDCITLPLSCHVTAKLRSGILLFGPPGTGKTLLAKGVATECKVNFISIKGPELLSMYIGESEKNVRAVFQNAKDAEPCVLFFDELDSLAPARGRGSDSGGVMDRIVSQLLTEIDGLPAKVFMIGATNRPDLLDSSLLRPGRLDRMVYLGIPEDKLPIFRAATRKFDFDPTILPELARKSPTNFTGADIAAVCSDAYMAALKEKTVQLESYAKALDMPLQAFLTGLSDGTVEDTLRQRLEVVEPEGKVLSVFVGREHFEDAIERVHPSISMEELAKYERLRDTFQNTEALKT